MKRKTGEQVREIKKEWEKDVADRGEVSITVLGGRHGFYHERPRWVASFDPKTGKIRVDDLGNPEFWLECLVPVEEHQAEPEASA